MRTTRTQLTRRALLGALAALPAAAAVPLPPSQAFRRPVPPPASAADVLDVMDFEPLARDALPPAHFGYLATGADDDRTAVRNHEAFGDIEIRARRFVDVSRVDTGVALYGARWASPVYLSAVSSQRAFHPDGELAVARAARSRNALLMISSGSSVPTDAVAAERGAPVWQQLYPTDDWAVTQALVRRIEEAGCPAIVLTVDTMPGRNNETLRRAMAADSRTCTDCHVGNNHDMWRKAPLYAGLDVSRVTSHLPMDLTPAYLDRLRAVVKVKLLVKGVVAAEDAALAVAHGADGVIVSNHGGRNEETLRASIDCLPEIAAAVRGRVPVLLDGGVRRGTDVFKALALGATAVGIGRPQGWGLAAFGQSGVEAVLDIFARELVQVMRQAGTPTLADIRPDRVLRRLAR
jgi:(S)-2-hydroxy-acid oxidase